MTTPFFSFVIPCYKASKCIAQTVGSIMDQDFKSYEIICVLDGPDELTETVLKAFPSVVVKVIKHGGVCKARNEGLKLANGEYILFSDADFRWFPGILRTFKEKIDETGADFVYSGYRWEDAQGGHIPPEFDAHLLTVSNICDGSNPVRTELVRKIGGWDESLKRFQDWDLWLRVVAHGGRGVRVADIAKATPYPKAGDISAQDNYEEAYQRVRKKHGIKDRRICVTSLAAPGHALRIAKLCGWDYWPDPSMLPNKYDAIYLIGCFPEDIDNNVRSFIDFDKKTPRNCKYLIHWIGTDVLNMGANIPFLVSKNIREMFRKHGVIHLVQSEACKEEMRELGFEIERLTLPVELNVESFPMPEKFTVAIYDHNGQDMKWHKWLCMEITKALPDVKFLFFGNKDAVGKDRNVEWMGNVKISDVIKQSSCLMRLTVHDGYPVAPIEFLYCGRRVITNVKEMPYTEHLEIGAVSDNRAVEIMKNTVKKIREVQRKADMGEMLKRDIIAYYNSFLDPKKFKKRIEEIVYAKG